MGKEKGSKRSFYEVLFELCEREGVIQKFIDKGYIIKTDNCYKFSSSVVSSRCSIEDVSSNRLGTNGPPEKQNGPENKDLQECHSGQGVLDLVNTMRTYFTKESLGVRGKCSTVQDVLPKISRFKEQYGYTDDTIIGACKLYAANIRTSKSFARELHYFVYKRLDGNKESEVSDLAKWCEEYLNGREATDYSSDI